MKDLVTFAHAIADETRWRMVQLMFDEPLCVCELADILKMPQSTVSSQIQLIKKAGLLDSEKCGKWIYYRVSPPHRPMLATLKEFFETSPSSHPLLKADIKNAAKRLADRTESCCPLPKKLTKLKPLKEKKALTPA